MEKLPPIEKVFEAWTALADNRVSLGNGEATVKSSDGAKEYTVKFRDDLFSSDDNASFWRSYAGYPVIAVLMLQGRLPYDKEEALLWKDVNWKALNTKYRNRYAEAVKEVALGRDIDMQKANSSAEAVMTALKSLPIVIKRKI